MLGLWKEEGGRGDRWDAGKPKMQHSNLPIDSHIHMQTHAKRV